MHSFFGVLKATLLWLIALNVNAANFFPLTVADLINDINTANTNSQDDIIDLGGNTFTLTAVDNGDNGLPVLVPDSGHSLLIQNGTIERDLAAANFRLFEIADFARINFADVTLRNGHVGGTAMSPKFGGAIFIHANGLLQTIARSTFDNNIADGGGAIYHAQYMNSVISNSTFSNNQATSFSFSDGGAFYITDSDGMIFRQCTFSGNAASGSAGALWSALGFLQIHNSTFTQNSAGNSGGAIVLGPSTDFAMVSTIVAQNTATTFGPDIYDQNNASITEANNLIGDNSDSNIVAGNPNGNSSFVGTALSPIDAMLAPLANNGGLVKTHALLLTSPAIDTGANPDSLIYDERGFGYLREFGPTDIGAFELSCAEDIDLDGICDDVDNCVGDANFDQEDSDGDGLGDVCDSCPDDRFNDADDDGICGNVDNCPFKANPGQEDMDNDGMGDACDTDNYVDNDEDNVCDYEDNCLDLANEDQADADGDNIGDACDECPHDRFNDADNDGICGDEDNCPFTANPDQTDTDEDDIGNACDECPADSGNDNDEDEDGICDTADRCVGFDDAKDEDNDGIPDDCDNCPLDCNYDQLDIDQDGVGDDCDDDEVLIAPPPPPPLPPAPFPPVAGPIGAGAGPVVDTVSVAKPAPKEIPPVEEAPEAHVPTKKKSKEPQQTVQEVEVPHNNLSQDDFPSSGCSLIDSKGQNVTNLWLLMLLLIGFMRATRSRSVS